jgi:hypothetical protein
MDQDREINPEELHQLVWSKPLRTVAKAFGLSDVFAVELASGYREPFF